MDTNGAKNTLATATDHDLLCHLAGLPRDTKDDVGEALLVNAGELAFAMANLIEISQPGAEVTLAEIGGTLEQIGRTLEVGVELQRRTRGATVEPLEREGCV